MIQNMMTDIAIFMVLFAIQLIIFASIGWLLFANISSYSSLYEAIKTVYSAALGNFDFTTLSSNDKSQYLGDAYLAIIMIINNILLLNLLVAILSSTYALLETKKMVLYINEILKLRNSLEYDRNCSSLVSSFPPWNLISLVFLPLIMIFKSPVYINNIVFHLNYIPLLLLVSVAYICSNAILLPFAYIKGIYETMLQIWVADQDTNLLLRILRFIFFLLFGSFLLVLNMIADTVAFFIHCYQHKMSYRKLFKKSYSLSKKSYYLLQNKFESEHRKNNSMIDYYSMAAYMREKMEVMEHIQGLIYGEFIDTHEVVTTDTWLKNIDEYVLVKKILLACSIRQGSNEYLYSEVMKSILKELKVTSRIKELIEKSSKSLISHNKSRQANNQYLSRFFLVNLANLHIAIEKKRDKKLDYQTIKDALQTVLYENIHLFGHRDPKISSKYVKRINNVSRGSNLSNSQKLKRIKSNVSALIDEAEKFVRK